VAAFSGAGAAKDRGDHPAREARCRWQTKLRLNVELQDDFSLNHTLSLYLIDTLALIDPASATYAADVMTLCESILENPDIILRRQLAR
jgi:hypothetical protein